MDTLLQIWEDSYFTMILGKVNTSKWTFVKVSHFLTLWILLKQNTALLSTLRVSVSQQVWHLNFSQLFDDLGHENHIYPESM